MIKRICFLSTILILLMGFLSCGTVDCLSCPYIIDNPHVELGTVEDKYNFAGMHFSLCNESSKTIEDFTMSFMLYDSDGNNPFVGSNCIVSKCKWNISAGALVEFIINLDPYISTVPDEPYQIDYIYVREINYTDGSSWKDPFGMYCVREAIE